MGTKLFLQRTQIGMESTYGTAVAATAVILHDVKGATEPGIYIPDTMTGVLAGTSPGVLTATKAGSNWDGDFSFEQCLYLFHMGLKTTTPSTTTGVTTWTYAPSPTGADSPKSFTLEKRFTDGSSPIDYEYPGTLASEITISGTASDGNEAVCKMKAELFSASEDTSTLTPALTIPTTWELAPANLATVYVDSSWAGLGGTKLEAQNFSFEWKLTTGFKQQFYNNGSLGSSGYSVGLRSVELKLSLDLGAQAAAFRTAMSSRALQFVQVKLSGSNIDGGTPTTARSCKLNGAYVVSKMPAPGSRDDNDTVDVTLLSRYDPTGAQDISAIVVNGVSALP